jgi:hypothetical protein
MFLVGNPRRNARKRNPPATRRRALELLAGSRDGCTEAIMLAHGFTAEMLVDLVRAGLSKPVPGAGPPGSNRQTEHRVLARPLSRSIAQASDADAARQPYASPFGPIASIR